MSSNGHSYNIPTNLSFIAKTGNSPDKEVYAKGFKDDLARLVPWLESVEASKRAAEGLANDQPDLKQTYLQQARIHDIHTRQLDSALVVLVSQLGNDMMERYRLGQKKALEDGLPRDCDSIASSIATASRGPGSTIAPPSTIISQSDFTSAPEGTMSTDALSLDTEGTKKTTATALPHSFNARFSRSLNVSPHRQREPEETLKPSIPSELRLGGSTASYDGDHSMSSVSKESSALRSGSTNRFRPVDAAAAKEIVLANREFLEVRPGSPADSSLASEDLMADDSWILPVNSGAYQASKSDTSSTLDIGPGTSLDVPMTTEGSVDWNKALQTHLKTLEERESRLRKYHPDTAKSYNNLGHIYCKLGNWNEALHYHSLALEVRESVLGKEHLDTVRSYSSVGYVYFKKCDWDEALLYYRMALDVQESVLGKNHVDTAKSHKSMSVVLSKKGDWNEALRHHQMALEAREAREGTNGNFGKLRASWQGRVRSVPSSIAEE